jgi:hypothetical protein
MNIRTKDVCIIGKNMFVEFSILGTHHFFHFCDGNYLNDYIYLYNEYVPDVIPIEQ